MGPSGESNWRLIPYGLKLQNEKSSIIEGGGWALPRPHISYSPSQETSPTTHTWKRLLGDQRGFMSRDIPYSDAFSLKSILTKSCVCTRWRILRYTKHGLWTRQIKMMGQRKSGGSAPHKWFKLPRRSNSGTIPLSPPMCFSTCTVLLLGINICFTTFHICGKSFLQNWRTRVLVTDHCLVARIWCFSTVAQPISGWEAKTCSKPLQAKVTNQTDLGLNPNSTTYKFSKFGLLI